MQPTIPPNLSGITASLAGYSFGKILASFQTNQNQLRAATAGLTNQVPIAQIAAQLGALTPKPFVTGIASLKFDTGIARMLSETASLSTPMSVLNNFKMERPEVNSKLISDLFKQFEPRKA